MKKYLAGILIVLIMVLSAGSIIAADSQSSEDTDVQIISKNGVSIQFPSDWGISQAASEDSLVAISKLSSIDSDGIGQVNINVEKRAFNGTFDTFLNETYTSLQNNESFNLTSSGDVAVGDGQGVMYTYQSNATGVLKEHKAIWIEHNGEAYVVLYSAPVDQFEDNLYVFEYVMDNFKITA